MDAQLITLLSQSFGFMVNWATVGLGAGIFVTFRALNSWPLLSERNWYRRMLPILPELMGAVLYVFAALPVHVPEGFEVGHRGVVVLRLGLGLWSAYLAQKFRKILAQTVLGDDSRITLKQQDLTLLMAPDTGDPKDDEAELRVAPAPGPEE